MGDFKRYVAVDFNRFDLHFIIWMCIYMYVYIYIYIYIYIYTGVPGGMCQTSGGCSLC